MSIFKKKEKAVADYTEIKTGDGRVVSVLREPFPNQFWMGDPIIERQGDWKEQKAAFESILNAIGIHKKIDEVAVYFECFDSDLLFRYVQDAVQNPDVNLFNSAIDHVETSPIKSNYTVEYNFLEVDGLGMRVEVMRIDRGFSPLHHNMETGNDVHFSFKVSDSDYAVICNTLRNEGMELVQSCDSAYGAFSYWRVQGMPDDVYLKPRVNKRDVEATPPPNTDRGEFGHPGVGFANNPFA